jgi:hypothetical protein
MRFLRCLFGVLAGVGLGGRSQAMGSGPHPNVSYGLPVTAAHDLPNVAASVFITPILWTAIFLIFAGLLLWGLQARGKK